MSTSIRNYSPKDRNDCIAAFKSNVPQFFTQEEIGDFENFLIRYEANDTQDPERKRTHFYVLESDGKVVGCGGFGDRFGNGIVTLTWGHVHQHFHKKGLGKTLLEYRLAEAPIYFPGCTIFLDTTQHSAPFFEKFGFKTTKITEDFYTKGMHRYDMELTK